MRRLQRFALVNDGAQLMRGMLRFPAIVAAFRGYRFRRMLNAILGLALTVAAPLSIGPALAAEVTVKVAIFSSGDHVTARMSKLMGEEVERRLPGRVNWKVFEGGLLGTESETMIGLVQGTHMVTLNGGWFQNIAPEFGLFDTPFLFKNRDEARAVIKVIEDDLAKAIRPHGIVLVGIGDSGFRQITNNIRPITTPADLKGVKIRTPGNPFSIQTFQTLGANPTPMEARELYLALREGVVDGQENPLASIWSLKSYEVQKYISLSNHIFSPIFIGISARYWDRWPPDIQQAIREAAQVASDFSFEQDARKELTLRGRIQQANPDVRFNEIDRASFEKAVTPLLAEHEVKAGPRIWGKVMLALNDLRTSHKAALALP